MSQNREAPAYQEYAASILAQLPFRTMTLQDRGLYITMRYECWVNKQLPNNQRDLAKVLGLTIDEVNTSLPAVMPFFKAKGDFIICPELEDYRAHLAERKIKQSQGGKRGSAITNNKRKCAANTKDDVCSSTSTSNLTSISSSNPSTNLQVPCQGSDESSVKLNKAKPSKTQFINKTVTDNPFIAEYEAAEQCTASDYIKASQGK